MPHNSSLNASDVTIQAWVKPGATAAINVLRKGTTSGVANYNMYLSSRYLGFNFYTGAWNTHTDTTTLLPLNEWSHVAAVYSDSLNRVILYVNGAQVLSEAETASLVTNSEALQIGVSEGVQNFSGSIDEVRVYTRALLSDEIKRLYNITASKFNVPQTKKLTDGLVGHWTFDGKDIVATSSANYLALDRSGNNNHATAWNNPLKTYGKNGQALKFNGVSDYIDIGKNKINPLLNGAQAITISSWFKAKDNTDGRILSIMINGVSSGAAMDWEGGNWRVGGRSVATDPFQSTTISVSTNQWTNIVGILNFTGGDRIDVYKDGVLAISTSVTFTNSSWTQGTPTTESDKIGAYTSPVAEYFNGLIDEVRVYNRALSADEVKRLYNMGR